MPSAVNKRSLADSAPCCLRAAGDGDGEGLEMGLGVATTGVAGFDAGVLGGTASGSAMRLTGAEDAGGLT